MKNLKNVHALWAVIPFLGIYFGKNKKSNDKNRSIHESYASWKMENNLHVQKWGVTWINYNNSIYLIIS